MSTTPRDAFEAEIEAIEGALHDSWGQADRVTAILAAADKYADERVREARGVFITLKKDDRLWKR